MTRTELQISVYVVLTETNKVFRVTGDQTDAERYAAAYQSVSSHRGGAATIHQRTITI
jgi:hypothetical protein